jgi:branched-chain amino acid transport system substrate-binding protein
MSPRSVKGLANAAAVLALMMGTAAASAQQVYRFGLAMPLTGSQALYGQDQVKAAQWAVAEINGAGGINGKKLEMIVLDTQADPQLGIQAVNRLISVEKVPAFITAWSGVVKAVAPIANDNKVVELSVGANSPDVAKLGDYVYTTFPLADVDINAVARYSAGIMGKKKAAIIFVNADARPPPRSTGRCSPLRAVRSWPTRPTIRRPPISPGSCSRCVAPIPTSSTSRVSSPIRRR